MPLKASAFCLLAAVASIAMPLRAIAQIPPLIAAPGQAVILKVHAVGAQIYECKADSSGKLAWQFREPIATLLADGKTIGRHYAGPTWAFGDDSTVVGKVAASAPGATATDIAWLRLDVVSHRGSAPVSGATTVQRIDTAGGALSGACEKSGDYVFLRPN
jgi:hypothetical protein